MKRRQTDPWNFLFIRGCGSRICSTMTSAARNVHHSVRPQQGEISFCAYNTGVGWRQIIENMHKNATVAEWYKTHGKPRNLCQG